AYSPAPNGRISPMNGDPATRQEVLRLAGLIYVSTQVKPHVVRENEKAAPVRRVSLVAWTCLVIVYFVWGSTYLFIRIGVETMPPLLMAAARFLVAGMIMFPIALRRVRRWPTRKEWIGTGIVGVL